MSDKNGTTAHANILWVLSLPFLLLYILFYFRPDNFVTASVPWLHTTHPWLFGLPALVGFIASLRIRLFGNDHDDVSLTVSIAILFMVAVFVAAFIYKSNSTTTSSTPQEDYVFLIIPAIPLTYYMIYRFLRFGIILMWIPGGKKIHQARVAAGKRRAKADFIRSRK